MNKPFAVLALTLSLTSLGMAADSYAVIPPTIGSEMKDGKKLDKVWLAPSIEKGLKVRKTVVAWTADGAPAAAAEAALEARAAMRLEPQRPSDKGPALVLKPAAPPKENRSRTSSSSPPKTRKSRRPSPSILLPPRATRKPSSSWGPRTGR